MDHMPNSVHLEQLARTIECTGALIVLSSTWRLKAADKEQVKVALATYGLSLAGATPDLESIGKGDRVDEILHYVSTCAQNVAWIAVDDMNLLAMNPKKMHGRHFVHTSDNDGFTASKADEAIEKLLIRSK